MKHKITLFVLMLACFKLLHGQETGRIVIRNAADSYPKFVASLNGVRSSNDYLANVAFNYLDEEAYRVKIQQAGVPGVLSFVLGSAPKYVSQYIITKDNAGNFTVELESKTLISAAPMAAQPVSVAPSTVVVANPTNTLFVYNSQQVISDKDYSDMQDAIRKENFETGKLELAKTFFGTQYLAAEQVLGILKLMAFENNKLAFAKFAYPRTLDKQNYYKVYTAFDFDSSKLEMTNFINKQTEGN